MKRFSVILSLVVAFYIFKTLYQAGQFKNITNFNKGEVTRIFTNMTGPEDMQVDYATGNLFISATNRREHEVYLPENGIYILNLESENSPVILPNDYVGPFHPHGISIFRDDSLLYVFAVNHNEHGDFVESFLYQNDSLKHLQSYSYKDLCCPNDVVALSSDKFYVTNDHGTKKGFMRIVEDYLRIPAASLFYYNGEAFKEVAGPFLYANGVNMSNDGNYLYLTTTTGASLIVFKRLDDGALIEHSITDLKTGVDNIDVDNEGNLWIAAHPKLLSFVGHASDSLDYSPSQVLKLTPNESQEFEVVEVYMNDGNELSGSSVAVYYGNYVYVGGVFDRKLLKIKLNK